MFMKTMAVGPLDPVASWVTGGTGVARCLFWLASCGTAIRDEAWETLLMSWFPGRRKAIVGESMN